MYINWIKTNSKVIELTAPRKIPEKTPHQIQIKSQRYLIWFITEGSGTVSRKKSENINFNKNDIIWFKPKTEYSIEHQSKKLCLYSMHFELFNEKGNIDNQKLSLPPDIIKNADTKYIHILFKDLFSDQTDETLTPDNDQQSEKLNTLSKTVLMEIDEAASKNPQQQSEVTDDVYDTKTDAMAKIAYQYRHDPSFRAPISKLAEQLYMTPNNFSQSFKKKFGKTPKQYAIQCRINHASRLLVETAMSIKDIADMLGYNDPQLFAKQFQKVHAMTPSQFRKDHIKQKNKTLKNSIK